MLRSTLSFDGCLGSPLSDAAVIVDPPAPVSAITGPDYMIPPMSTCGLLASQPLAVADNPGLLMDSLRTQNSTPLFP
jgi:hypothetical protein